MSTIATPIQRYETGGGVVIYQQRMLLLNRPTRQEVRLPKGHIDPGESPVMTSLRETGEESGYVDLLILADLGSQVVTFQRDGQQYIRTEFYFLMTLQSETQIARPPEDATQFQPIWTPVPEAVAALTFEAEKNIARKAIEAYARL